MSRAERFEGAILVAIVVVVGGAAGAASFTHVHDWTMTNSPQGTPDWFGWANACISELVPIAALLEIRRRRRKGKGIGYPLALVFGAAGLSLAAQLAVAKPGFSGGLLSAVPAIAFMALVKLVLSAAPANKEVPVPGEDKEVPVPMLIPAPPRRPVLVPVPDGAVTLPIVPLVPEPPALIPDGVKLIPIRPVGAKAPAEGVPALVTAVPERRRRGTGTRVSTGTQLGASRGTGTGRGSDEELKVILKDVGRVPRKPNGKVAIKTAMRVLGTGTDRARRLLQEEGLFDEVSVL